MFPKYQEIQLPLLAELYGRGGESRPSELNAKGQTIYDALADFFELPDSLRSLQIFEKDGTPRSKWENMVRWARNDLRKHGYLSSPSRGIWKVTPSGVQILNESNEERAGENIFAAGLFISPEKFNSLKAHAEENGRLGEQFVFEQERRKLLGLGRTDLAGRVRLVSGENVAAGFDVLSYDADGQERYIEVKTTAGQSTSFEISSNELTVAKRLQGSYWIYRVTEIRSAAPQIQEFQNPMKLIEENKLIVKPTSFRIMMGENFEG